MDLILFAMGIGLVIWVYPRRKEHKRGMLLLGIGAAMIVAGLIPSVMQLGGGAPKAPPPVVTAQPAPAAQPPLPPTLRRIAADLPPEKAQRMETAVRDAFKENRARYDEVTQNLKKARENLAAATFDSLAFLMQAEAMSMAQNRAAGHLLETLAAQIETFTPQERARIDSVRPPPLQRASYEKAVLAQLPDPQARQVDAALAKAEAQSQSDYASMERLTEALNVAARAEHFDKKDFLEKHEALLQLLARTRQQRYEALATAAAALPPESRKILGRLLPLF